MIFRGGGRLDQGHHGRVKRRFKTIGRRVMKGRKPVPTSLKILRGTFRKDRGFDPRPQIRIPPCPKLIMEDEEARREWRRVSRELKALGLLTLLDRAALSAYCVLWSRWVDAEAKVREKGSVIRSSDNNPVLNPFFKVALRTLQEMRAMLVEFGLTPSSRTRVAANPVAGNDDDPDERFFKLPS
jgi:P27 family predicted phage terminase small subunit